MCWENRITLWAIDSNLLVIHKNNRDKHTPYIQQDVDMESGIEV